MVSTLNFSSKITWFGIDKENLSKIAFIFLWDNSWLRVSGYTLGSVPSSLKTSAQTQTSYKQVEVSQWVCMIGLILAQGLKAGTASEYQSLIPFYFKEHAVCKHV